MQKFSEWDGFMTQVGGSTTREALGESMFALVEAKERYQKHIEMYSKMPGYSCGETSVPAEEVSQGIIREITKHLEDALFNLLLLSATSGEKLSELYLKAPKVGERLGLPAAIVVLTASFAGSGVSVQEAMAEVLGALIDVGAYFDRDLEVALKAGCERDAGGLENASN